MPILILRTGDALTDVAARRGEFSDWIVAGIGDAWARGFDVHDARSESPLPSRSSIDGVVVTGSASSVTERAAWMLRAEAWLRDVVAAEIPVLGICFGHQLLGQALGGEVTRNPRGREIGTVRATLAREADGDPLFEGLGRAIDVNATHVDTVAALPPGATVLARTELEPHACFRVGPTAWGVQFHPEIDGDVIRSMLVAREGLVRGEGLPFDALLAGARDVASGPTILRNFGRVVSARR